MARALAKAAPRALAWAAAVGCWASAALAAPTVLIDLDDPPHDAYGPGSYSPPTDADLQGGDFDLRKFVAKVEGNFVVLEVTLGEVIRLPASAYRSNETPVDLDNGLFFQNIDIYVDTDPKERRGMSIGIPGRRVAFAEGRTWKRAVVLAPQRGPVRAVIENALGPDAFRVLVPGPLTTRGRTVVVKVPISFFGAEPSKGWGWSVHVSGAAWERNFFLVDQLKGTARSDALTMPVSTTAERWAFGGAELGRFNPQVVDITVPKGQDQRAVLSTYDNENGKLAEVPFVYGEAPPALEDALPPPYPAQADPALAAATAQAAAAQAKLPPKPAPDGWTVADLNGDLVAISGPTEGITGMMFGQVLDAKGAVVAKVVVMQVLPSGIVANTLDNRDKIAKGARVLFTLPKHP